MCFSVSQIMLYDVQQLKYQEQSCIIILVAELLYPITQSQNNRNWTKRDLTGLISTIISSKMLKISPEMKTKHINNIL